MTPTKVNMLLGTFLFCAGWTIVTVTQNWLYVIAFMVLFMLGTFWFLLYAVEHVTLLRVISFFTPNTQVVKVMHYDHEVNHAIAYGDPHNVMKAHVSWYTHTGPIYLHPNGLVSGLSFISVWEPLDEDHKTAMHLTYDLLDFQTLLKMTKHELYDYRRQLARQLKLQDEHNL